MDEELGNLIVQKYRLKAGLNPEVPKVEVKPQEDKHYHRGYYTGAFDILHIGHARALQAAASMCDQLIVGVSTDEVIRGYKHHNPTLPYEHRSQLVSCIEGVTMVVPQYDLYNKLEVCQDLGCDVIFSCEEYQRSFYQDPSQMTEKEKYGVERWERFEQQANEHGIDVVYLPRVPEFSSTAVKDDILKTFTPGEEPASLLCSVSEANFGQDNFGESATL